MSRADDQRWPEGSPGRPDGWHPAPEEIALLAEKDPAPQDRTEQVEPGSDSADHVAGCVSCQRTLADIRRTRAILATLPAEPLPAAVAARLERALATEAAGASATSGRPAGRRRVPWPLAAAAAATVLAGGGVLWNGAREHGGPAAPTSAQQAVGGPSRSAGGPGGPLGGPGMAGDGDPATLPALVRSLVAARQQPRAMSGETAGANPRGMSPAGPGRAAGVDPAVMHCLAVLGVPSARLLLAAEHAFAGGPATVLVLSVDRDPTLVDVRVVHPGCPRGTADVRYRLNRLSVS